jgi:hypothetical protein
MPERYLWEKVDAYISECLLKGYERKATANIGVMDTGCGVVSVVVNGRLTDVSEADIDGGLHVVDGAVAVANTPGAEGEGRHLVAYEPNVVVSIVRRCLSRALLVRGYLALTVIQLDCVPRHVECCIILLIAGRGDGRKERNGRGGGGVVNTNVGDDMRAWGDRVRSTHLGAHPSTLSTTHVLLVRTSNSPWMIDDR